MLRCAYRRVPAVQKVAYGYDCRGGCGFLRGFLAVWRAVLHYSAQLAGVALPGGDDPGFACDSLRTPPASREASFEVVGRIPGGFEAEKAAAVAVLSLSAVYALWFGTVFTDHMCVSSGAEPMFARQQPDGSWQGVFYRINNGTVLIFGQKGE